MTFSSEELISIFLQLLINQIRSIQVAQRKIILNRPLDIRETISKVLKLSETLRNHKRKLGWKDNAQ